MKIKFIQEIIDSVRNKKKNSNQSFLNKIIGQCLSRKYSDVIIMVDGGFCSTMAKYALGKCFEKKLGVNVKYDLTWFDFCGMDCDGKFKRSFNLNKIFPNINLEVATDDEVVLYKKFFSSDFSDKLLNKKRPLYVDGYYNVWDYSNFIKDELISDFNFSSLKLSDANQKYLNEINSNDASVAIHVRRGDYVNLGLCVLTPEYYISAIEYIAKNIRDKNPHLYFFSDGMDWVKENIISNIPKNISYSFVEENDNDTGYIDLYLISQCKHQISSNSSFGFWGGFLNQNDDKIVIIPEKWTPSENVDSELAHRMPGWVCLPCDGLKENAEVK